MNKSSDFRKPEMVIMQERDNANRLIVKQRCRATMSMCSKVDSTVFDKALRENKTKQTSWSIRYRL